MASIAELSKKVQDKSKEYIHALPGPIRDERSACQMILS